ncbi:MAG: monovalent cation/H+ antiporter complex subunit F [Defluviitaleaceae bacterium]|nr:monovalent cation/H+ antiporter complex subunit F [Defluviitaleaceae bacterium]
MYYILFVMLIFLLAGVLKSIIGPTLWDRLLCMNIISTKIIIIIIVYASMMNIDYLLDFAIIYSLMGFVCTIFISSFIAERMKSDKNDGEEKH